MFPLRVQEIREADGGEVRMEGVENKEPKRRGGQ